MKQRCPEFRDQPPAVASHAGTPYKFSINVAIFEYATSTREV